MRTGNINHAFLDRLIAVYCVNDEGQALMPCVRCRQLLYEHGGPDMFLMTPQGVRTMADVLPQAFGPVGFPYC
jgi:cytidine deaminase